MAKLCAGLMLQNSNSCARTQCRALCVSKEEKCLYFHSSALTLLNRSLPSPNKSSTILLLLSGTQVAFKIKARPGWPRNVNLLCELKFPKTHLGAETPSWPAGGFAGHSETFPPSTVCAACFWFHKVFKARWGCRIRPCKGHFMRGVVVSFILLLLPFWSFGIFKEKLKLKSLLKPNPALIQVHRRGWGAKFLPLQMGNNTDLWNISRPFLKQLWDTFSSCWPG